MCIRDSASNAYFTQLVSAISIPKPTDIVREVICKYIKQFEKIDSPEKLELFLEMSPDFLAKPLENYKSELIFDTLQAIRGGETTSGSEGGVSVSWRSSKAHNTPCCIRSVTSSFAIIVEDIL